MGGTADMILPSDGHNVSVKIDYQSAECPFADKKGCKELCVIEGGRVGGNKKTIYSI